MKTVRDILQDADPLRHEPHRLEDERDRLRQAVVAAASDVTPSSTSFQSRVGLLAIVALFVVGIVAVGSQIWSQGGSTLQAAAVRFEVRLAEDRPAAGLRETRIVGSDRVVYLHPEVIVTNSDIAQSRVIPGEGPSIFGVGVQFNEAGAEKMRRATGDHIGRPVAILIDGEVVSAPVLRGPIGESAWLSGLHTKADAERIVNGIGIR
jgi:hypothetical protein